MFPIEITEITPAVKDRQTGTEMDRYRDRQVLSETPLRMTPDTAIPLRNLKMQ